MATTLDELQLDVFGLFMESATHSGNRSRISNLAEISECNTDMDIYGDLLAEPNDTEQKCSSLKHELGELIGENRKLIEENVKLQENTEQLRRNISSLFLTSKRELQRKEQEITQLRNTIKELQRVSKPSLSSDFKHTRLSTHDHGDRNNARRHRQDQDRDGRNNSLSMKQQQETFKNMKDYSQSRHKRNNSHADSHSRSRHAMAYSRNLMPARSEKSKKEKGRSECANTSQNNRSTTSHRIRHDSHALHYITTDLKKGHKRKLDESTHKIGSRKKKICAERQQIDFEPQSLATAMSAETSATNLEKCSSEHIHDYSADSKSKVNIKSKCEIRNSAPTLQHEMLDASSCHSKSSEERHEDNRSLDQVITLEVSDVANSINESTCFGRVTSMVTEKPLSDVSHVECRQNSLSIVTVELRKISDSKSAYPENNSTSSPNFSGIMFDSKISKDLHTTERADSINMAEKTKTEKHSSGEDSEVHRSDKNTTRTLGKCIMKSDDNKKRPLKSNDACNSHTETSNVTVDITTELPVTHITCTSNLILLGDEETTCTTYTSPSKYHSLPSEFYPPGIRGNIHDTGSHVRHIRGQTEVIKNLSTEAYSSLKEHKKSSQISTATTEKDMSETPNIQSVSEFNVQNVTGNLCVTDISRELNYARADDIQKQHGDTPSVMWHKSTNNNLFKKTEDRKCEGIQELQKSSSVSHSVSNVVSQEWVSMVKEMYVDVFKKDHHAFKQEMADQAHSDVKKQSSGNKYMMAEKSALLNISYQSKNSKHRSMHRLSSVKNVKTDTEKCDIPGSSLLDHTVNNSQHVNKDSKNKMTKQAMFEDLHYSQKMNGAAVEVGSQPELSPDSSVVTSSDHLVEYTNSSKPIQNLQLTSYHSAEKICYHEPDSTSDPKLYSELTVGYCAQMCEDLMSVNSEMHNNFVEQNFCNMEKRQSNGIMQRHCQNSKKIKRSKDNSPKKQKFDHSENSGSIAGIQRQAERQHIQLSKLHEHASSSDANACFGTQVHSNVLMSSIEDSDKRCCISTASENNRKLLTNSARDCTCIQRKSFKSTTSDILNQQLQEDYVNDCKACSSDDTNYEVSVPTLVCDEITLIEEGSLSEFDSDIVCSFSDNAYSLRGKKNNLHGSPSKQCKVALHKQRIKNKQVNEAKIAAYSAKEANKLPAQFTRLSDFRQETVADLDSKIRMAKFKSDEVEVLKLEEDTASRHKTFQELQQQRLVKRSYGYNYSLPCTKT